jgi:dinuclear metal center YbgI/SA1388 family protein
MEIGTLVAYCDQLLDVSTGGDYGPNGLQVEGTRPVRRLVSGVSASVELFERARELDGDVVLVHHGILWNSAAATPLTGFRYRRLASLIGAGLHLVAYHLPLDRHPELGNNVLAAKQLGLYALEPFAEHRGAHVGYRGTYPEPIAPATLVARCREAFAQEPVAFLHGRDAIARVGVVSGGAQEDLYAAIDAGLDAFVTGEVSEWVMQVAREAGIHFLACGHYATERLGIRALGDHLAGRFGLDHVFVELPNPV